MDGDTKEITIGDTYLGYPITQNTRINGHWMISQIKPSLGDLTTFQQNVAITGALTASTLKLTTAPGTNKVLTSDSQGNATWQTAIAPTSQTYRGIYNPATTYQLVHQVTQPVQLPIVSKLYADSVTPGSTFNNSTIHNGLTLSFTKSGIVTAVQIYVPTGVRPNAGYTVYFHMPSGTIHTKLLPKASIVDGWNTIVFDTGVPVVTGTYYLVAYRTDGVYAWSNNTTPFGSITDNQITPVNTWTSR